MILKERRAHQQENIARYHQQHPADYIKKTEIDLETVRPKPDLKDILKSTDPPIQKCPLVSVPKG